MISIQKSFYWLFALGLFCHGVAQAQMLGPYGTSPITVEVDANGLLSDTGTYGTGSLSLSGAGTRMIWYPGKAAFRAGYVSGTDWDDANIGVYSAAFGQDTVASSWYAFASGYQSTASGGYSTAMGANSLASGQSATAMGHGATASGYYSTALGLNVTASGWYGTALGAGTTATGATSTALGDGTTAYGTCSTAMGYGTLAEGSTSTALGQSTTAYGKYTTAMGNSTEAFSYESVVMGQFNVGGGSYTIGWLATDPIFEIGNGTSSSALSDALVVYKNGSATFQGPVSVAAGGDIPMFTGY